MPPEQDFFEEGDEAPDEEPGWHPPMPCPQCRSTETRFVTYHHDIGVYFCEICEIQFEAEE